MGRGPSTWPLRLLAPGALALLVGGASAELQNQPPEACPCRTELAPPSPPPIGSVGTDRVLPLRAAAEPGDTLLRNAQVSAVIRRKDGTLADFWNEKPSPSSTPQLRGLTAIDGLQSLRRVLWVGSLEIDLGDKEQVREERALLVRRTIRYSGAELSAETRYRLVPDQAAIEVETTLRHVGGGSLHGLRVGERVRWGNSDYFVDDQRAPSSFLGKARRVARHGAGGDLALFDRNRPLKVEFHSTQPGMRGELKTESEAFSLGHGETHTEIHVLAYQKIPEKPAPSYGARLEVEVKDEDDRPLAAKLGFLGLGSTRTPDFGNGGDESGANRFVWSGTGQFSRPLAPGRYRVMATAGIERDAAVWDVTLAAGEVTRRSGRLSRVIDTPGRIAADLHLHQAASPDADIACSTRVISVAAEGVELAVASDHYTVGNLAPALSYLTESGQLKSRLLVVAGTEVTTTGTPFGHFNVFPLAQGTRLPFEDTTPAQLFDAVRKTAPQALLQVNHPRWSPGGYFARYRMDPKTGRVPQSLVSEYRSDFDALEVFNGFDAWSTVLVRNVLKDYLHLVAQGHRYTATGNSDSHGLFFWDPGLPHNLIRFGDSKSDRADLDADPNAVMAAIRAGQVVVTNGPVLDVDADGVGPGGALHTGGRPVMLHVRVRAAPWVDVRQVEVLRGGSGERVRLLPIPRSKNVVRFDEHLKLPAYSDGFLMVVASGTEPLPNVYRDGVKPLAFTNPIYLLP